MIITSPLAIPTASMNEYEYFESDGPQYGKIVDNPHLENLCDAFKKTKTRTPWCSGTLNASREDLVLCYWKTETDNKARYAELGAFISNGILTRRIPVVLFILLHRRRKTSLR